MENPLQINKLFVSTFQILSKYEKETTKFKELANVFGTLSFNQKLLLKIISNYQHFSEEKDKMVYFKNTDFTNIFAECTEEEQKTINSNLVNIYELAQKYVLFEHLNNPIESCEELFKDERIKKLLKMSNINIKKIKKMLGNNAKFKEMLEKNSNLPEGEQFSNLLSNLFKNNDMLQSLTSIFSNGTIQKIFEDFNNAFNDNKIKDVLNEIYKRVQIEHPDVIKEIDKLFEIFNQNKVKEILQNIKTEIQNFKFTDIAGLIEHSKKFIDNDETIQSVLWKLHMAFK